MAVGKGSMERAAKAAESKEAKKDTRRTAAKAKPVKEDAAKTEQIKTVDTEPAVSEAASAKKTVDTEPAVSEAAGAKKTETKGRVSRTMGNTTRTKANAKTETTTKTRTVEAAQVITAPSEEVLGAIVYQPSRGMLERPAEPNERFGLGDDMPVYYF